MKFKTIASIAPFIFFLFLAAWIIFYPSIYTKRESLIGEVVMVWKTAPPRQSWKIDVREGEKIRLVDYPFINDVITIQAGDSLRKEKGSEEFFLKRKNTKNWILLERKGLLQD